MNQNIRIFSVVVILLLISSSYIQSANSTEVTVPPTPAIAGLVTNSGTYNAPNYNSIPNLSGINGISTSASGSNIIIDGSGANAGNSSEIVQPTQRITKYSQETVISNFQKNNGWTDQTSPACGLTYNTTSFIQGNQSAQLNLFGNGTACTYRSPIINPTINIKNQVLVFWILTNDTLRFSDFRLTVTNDTFTHFTNFRIWGNSISSLNWIMPNMWQKVSLSLTASDTSATPDYTNIKQIQFKVTDTGTNVNKHPIRVQLAGLGFYPIADYPIVSFTFDNNDITQYTQAMPALDIWHYPATAFVPTNFIGIDSSHMTLQQLHNLYSYHGWDISPKTKDNPTMTAGYSSSYLNSQIHDSKYYLLTNGFSTGVDITAYNHGAFNQTVLNIESQYEKAGRTIAEGCPNTACGGLSETYPPADWYRLRVLDVLNSTSITAVENRLDLAYKNHDWVIVELHQVEPTAPLTSSEQILTSTFGTIVNYTHTKGFKVETISQVLNNFPNPTDIAPNTCTGSQVANGINSTGYLSCVTVSGSSGSENSTVTNLGSGAAITTTPSSQNGGNVNLRSITTTSTLSATTNTTSIILNDTGTTPDSSFYHRLRGQSWYSACYGPACQVNTGSVITNVNATIAYPMLVGKGYTIDKIEFEVTHQGAGRCITGIYDDNGTLYPRNLVVTGTDQSTASTNGTRIDNVSYSFKSDSIYWVAINCSSGTPTLRSLGGNAIASILGNTGIASTGSNIIGYRVTKNNLSSGFALDSTYPSTGSIDQLNSNLALVQFRAK